MTRSFSMHCIAYIYFMMINCSALLHPRFFHSLSIALYFFCLFLSCSLQNSLVRIFSSKFRYSASSDEKQHTPHSATQSQITVSIIRYPMIKFKSRIRFVSIREIGNLNKIIIIIIITGWREDICRDRTHIITNDLFRNPCAINLTQKEKETKPFRRACIVSNFNKLGIILHDISSSSDLLHYSKRKWKIYTKLK